MSSEIKSNKESRWHRPRLYLTVVGIYLLVNFGIFLLIIGDLLYEGSVCNDSAYICSHRYDRGTLAGGFIILGAGFIGFIFLGIPSIMASVDLIWEQKKSKYFPLAALILWDLFFVFLTLWDLSGISGNHLELYLETALFALALFGSNGLMFVFLIKGWKQVKWDTNQPETT